MFKLRQFKEKSPIKRLITKSYVDEWEPQGIMQEPGATSITAATTPGPQGQREKEGPRTQKQSHGDRLWEKFPYIKGKASRRYSETGSRTNCSFSPFPPISCWDSHWLSTYEARSFRSPSVQSKQVSLGAESRLETGGEEKQMEYTQQRGWETFVGRTICFIFFHSSYLLRWVQHLATWHRVPEVFLFTKE